MTIKYYCFACNCLNEIDIKIIILKKTNYSLTKEFRQVIEKISFLEINICKTKQLTNMRSAGAEELDTLQTPLEITLERALEYIGPGEMLEVTPDSIRLRKLSTRKSKSK